MVNRRNSKSCTRKRLKNLGTSFCGTGCLFVFAEDVETDKTDDGGDDFEEGHNKEGVVAGEESVNEIRRIAESVAEANPFDFTVPERPSVDERADVWQE